MTTTNEVPMRYLEYLGAYQKFNGNKMRYAKLFAEMTKTYSGRIAIISALDSMEKLDDFVGFCEWIEELEEQQIIRRIK